jgi:tetratricopeptide (TPR) repeat protein
MAKRYFAVIIIVSLFFLIGCQSRPNSGGSRKEPVRTGTTQTSAISIADAGEIDLVEQVVASRQAYRANLDALVRYYNRAGNNDKLMWSSKELNALDSIPWYKYLIASTNITQEEYKATTMVPDADLLYDDALLLENEAKLGGVLVTNKDKYRAALNKYEQLIIKYPTSDKIDDASYQCGEISEYFKDYTIALEYYQKAYQLNPDLDKPARFRAARILDQRMHRSDEALKLYKEAIATEGRYSKYLEWKKNAEARIVELEKTGS